MNNKELSEFARTLVIVSITFCLIFIISVTLYFNTSYIEEIILFLLLIPSISLLFLHDYLELERVFIISMIVSIIILLLGVGSMKIFGLINFKVIFFLSVFPILFISLQKLLYHFFFKIYKRSPYFFDKEKYKIEDFLYNFFLLVNSIVIPFLIYESIKSILFQ